MTPEPAAIRWRAFFAGHVIADSANAVVARMPDQAPSVYFPRDDVAMEYMSRTEARRPLPGGGDAACYTLYMDGELAENAVYVFEEGALAGRIAFDPWKVEVYPVDDAAVNPHHKLDRSDHHRAHDVDIDVDEVVRHTDSGAGQSQDRPWEPTVRGPGPHDGGVR